MLQRRAVPDIEFGSLWLTDYATICATLSIRHAQLLTNEMAGAQRCHNFQVDVLWVLIIASVTFNSSSVFLIEGLCSSNPWEFEFSGF